MKLAREQKKKKVWNMKVTVIPIVIGALRTIPKVCKRKERGRNQKTNRDHPKYNVVKISQNIEKTSEKDHQLKLV